MDSISPPPPAAVLDSAPAPAPRGSAFDPFDQLLTFYGPDGRSVIGVPMAAVDGAGRETASTSFNYGAQLGAALVMAAALLILTPAAKLRRPSALLQVTALVLCMARTGFLMLAPLSPEAYFYVFWAGDYASVAMSYAYAHVVGHVVSLLLVVAVEAALMNQAWTMVSLWPEAARNCLAAASAVITLATIGFRFALTVANCKAVFDLTFPLGFLWLMEASLITNAISIFWFCALFNSKLLLHLVSNRGMLPSVRTLSSMEVLVMTNGVLMVVPVVFAGLEWGHFENFEAASLTPTSVAIILPLGTLAAQRMTSRPSSGGSGPRHLAYIPHGGSSAGSAGTRGRGVASHDSAKNGHKYSATPQDPSLSASCDSAGGGGRRGPVEDHFDLELRQLDSESVLTSGKAASQTAQEERS